MWHSLTAQLVGFVAVGFSLAVFQVNNRKTMLTLTIVAGLFWTCHFYLLGAATGSAMNLIGSARSYIFRKQSAKQSFVSLVFFCLLFIVVTVITWQGIESLLPLGGMLAGSYAFWQINPKRIRAFALIAPPLWFTYNLIVGSYAGVLIEVINVGSNVLGIYRFDRAKIHK